MADQHAGAEVQRATHKMHMPAARGAGRAHRPSPWAQLPHAIALSILLYSKARFTARGVRSTFPLNVHALRTEFVLNNQ